MTASSPNWHDVSESRPSSLPPYSIQQSLMELFNFATKWILTNFVYKYTSEFYCVSFDTWREVDAQTWKSRIWLSPAFNHYRRNLFVVSTLHCLCLSVVLMQNFRMKTKLPKCAWNGMEWNWWLSVAEARTHGLRGCFTTISFEYQKEYHISAMVMVMLCCYCVWLSFFPPQTLERMQRLYTFFVLTHR